ncbi:hypothetical protein [Nocardioides sp.]|uniref:hypothetical protein n=1 Tax=Nocardioides sp. TaxID=35761 RepID=UPI003569A3B9
MSSIQLGQLGQLSQPAARRVRHQAKDALALMAFSAAMSVCLAAVLMFLANLPTLG